MSVPADVLTTLHLILQLGFVGVTFLLLVVTIVNRLRVRQVWLSWPTGRLLGIPLWPSVFLGAVLGLFTVSAAVGSTMPLYAFAGYLLGGLCWLAAAWLAGTVLVTAHGLLPDVNRPDHAVAWEQIVDYFETAGRRECRYVFLYLDDLDHRQRLEIRVPIRRAASFQHFVRTKLDARFDLPVQHVYGKKALEG